MARRFAKLGPVWMAGFLVCATAGAQFVPLSRCHGAFPCSIPFAVEYRPDPFLAGQYGNTVSHVPLVVSVPMTLPLNPRLETSTPTPLGAALEDAIHRSLQSGHPAGGDRNSGPQSGATPARSPKDEKQPETQR